MSLNLAFKQPEFIEQFMIRIAVILHLLMLKIAL